MPPYHTRRPRGPDSPMRQEPSKRRRIGGEEQNANPNSSPHAATAAAGPDRPLQPPISIDPRSSYLDTVAILGRLSESDLASRYKEWRLSGSAHDTYCRVCGRRGRLESCETCRLAFHGSCKPQGWIRDSLRRWFCPFCVRNNWHISAPNVTPPASPGCRRRSGLVPEESESGAGSGIAGDEGAVAPGGASSVSHSLMRSPGSSVAEVGRAWPPQGSVGGGMVGARRVSRAITEDLLSRYSGDRSAGILARDVDEGHNHHQEQQQQQQQQPPPVSSETRDPETRFPSTINQEGDGPATTRRHRRSRFSTLSSEVEDSISVIYRELESVQSLRKEVEQLSEEKDRLMQGIRIRDHDISYLNRQLESRPLDTEVQRLREHAKRLDGIVRDLREENAALKTYVRTAEEQAAAANEALNEWKGRLATLMQ